MATFVITAGPTHEHIDDVRFLANGSSGRMGFAIAGALAERGHRCVLVAGPVELAPPAGVDLIRVVSAEEMLAAALEAFDGADAAIGVAAVCDWRPAVRLRGKPPKSESARSIDLVPNPDIIARLGADKGDRVVVGFGLEAAADRADMLARGRRKLEGKNLDLIALNGLGAMGADESSAVLLFADGRTEDLAPQPKAEIAARIAEAVTGLVGGRADG